jgi:hypothetical protein
MPHASQIVLELAVEVIAMHAAMHEEAEDNVFGPDVARMLVFALLTVGIHGSP